MINKDVATISIGSEGLSGRTSWGYISIPSGQATPQPLIASLKKFRLDPPLTFLWLREKCDPNSRRVMRE